MTSLTRVSGVVAIDGGKLGITLYVHLESRYWKPQMYLETPSHQVRQEELLKFELSFGKTFEVLCRPIPCKAGERDHSPTAVVPDVYSGS